MAYPGENEHVEYLQYVEEAQSNGEKPMSKEEWRKLKKKGRAPRTDSAQKIADLAG